MKSVGIRDLAYFVYQSGNLTNENQFKEAATDGRNIHNLRQSEYTGEAISEYFLSKELPYDGTFYNFHGYVDGVLEHKDRLVIEEIKTTAKDIYHEDFTYLPEHIAQAKIYAYLLLLDSSFDEAEVNLLYIERTSLKRRNYKFNLNKIELENFFYSTITIFFTYYNSQLKRGISRVISTKSAKFPLENIRPGQDKMMDIIEENFTVRDILYVLAPTGIGKTIASLYSSLKVMDDPFDKLFYLTAKASGKSSVIKALKILIDSGIPLKAVVLTAKKKICSAHMKYCNPEECPFAKGFFSKLNEATKKIIEENDIITEETILEYSFLYEICSFEFSLNISTNVDVIICDYNYVFDPVVKLIRFFDEDTIKPYLLIDEAHNLLSRSQDMYSTTLTISDLLILKDITSQFESNVSREILKLINYIHKEYDLKVGYNNNYVSQENDLILEDYIYTIADRILFILENELVIKNKDLLLEKYFILITFLRISRIFTSTHVFLVLLRNNNLEIQLKCLDASYFVKNIIRRSTKGAVFFSATLYPVTYYKDLLTEGEGNYLGLESPFDPDNLSINICPISTRYKDRMYTLNYIIDIIKTVINSRDGKYIVFFPSYEYLNLVYDNISLYNYEIIKQEPNLTEFEQNKVFDSFKEEKNILGLFVLGGSFSEGMDFVGDLLHGVIVIGVGYPKLSEENELLKSFYNSKYNKGEDYAYTYPGFNKVIQASGRVIRQDTDKGILVLIDDRYLYPKYKNVFPLHWKNIKLRRSIEELDNALYNFWQKNKG